MAAAVDTPATASEAITLMNGGRVLVVVEAHDHAVIGAADGQEALRFASDWKSDFGLLDLELPAIDGCEAAMRLCGYLHCGDMRIVASAG
jgi:CheY-like chemotaxis protein